MPLLLNSIMLIANRSTDIWTPFNSTEPAWSGKTAEFHLGLYIAIKVASYVWLRTVLSREMVETFNNPAQFLIPGTICKTQLKWSCSVFVKPSTDDSQMFHLWGGEYLLFHSKAGMFFFFFNFRISSKTLLSRSQFCWNTNLYSYRESNGLCFTLFVTYVAYHCIQWPSTETDLSSMEKQFIMTLENQLQMISVGCIRAASLSTHHTLCL